MKKHIVIIGISMIILLFSIFNYNEVFAVKENTINNGANSTLVELKDKTFKSLQDYEEAYNSKSYGYTAYILNKVRIFSIPVCFLGIVIGAICNYVTGIRHLETKEKGLALMVTFITLGIICQILPFVFTVVVKFGRE